MDNLNKKTERKVSFELKPNHIIEKPKVNNNSNNECQSRKVKIISKIYQKFLYCFYLHS